MHGYIDVFIGGLNDLVNKCSHLVCVCVCVSSADVPLCCFPRYNGHDSHYIKLLLSKLPIYMYSHIVWLKVL